MIEHCWPVHPQPLPDEIFLSWISRAARTNGQKLFTLCDITSKGTQILNRDIDRSISRAALETFAIKLNTTYESAFNTTLESYEGLVFEKHFSKGVSRHILQAGIHHRTRTSYAQQFCPECLAESIPYYRKFWRLIYATVCTKHGIRLYDRCPNCNQPIMFFRNELKEKNMPYRGSFTLCHQCKFDLSKADSVPANNAVIKETKKCQQIINNGFASIPSHSWIYSFQYFEALRQILKIILILQTRDNPSHIKLELEVQPINYRYSCMKECAGLMDNWPNTFVSFCKENKIFSSLVFKDFHNRPYWFDYAVNEYLFGWSSISPNEESINCAIKHLLSKGINVSCRNLNKLMGYTDSQNIARAVKKYKQGKQNNRNIDLCNP